MAGFTKNGGLTNEYQDFMAISSEYSGDVTESSGSL